MASSRYGTVCGCVMSRKLKYQTPLHCRIKHCDAPVPVSLTPGVCHMVAVWTLTTGRSTANVITVIPKAIHTIGTQGVYSCRRGILREEMRRNECCVQIHVGKMWGQQAKECAGRPTHFKALSDASYPVRWKGSPATRQGKITAFPLWGFTRSLKSATEKLLRPGPGRADLRPQKRDD